MAYPNNYVSTSVEEEKNSTHIEGRLIDHVYQIQGDIRKFSYVIEEFPNYYCDHDQKGMIFALCTTSFPNFWDDFPLYPHHIFVLLHFKETNF